MRKNESGFSLVEVMIASAILVISIGGIATVLRVSATLHSTTQQGLELQENVRASLDFICRELINAGSGIPYLTKINGSPAITVPVGARLGPLGAAVTSDYVYFVTPCHFTGSTVTVDGEGGDLPHAVQTDMLVFLGGMGDARFVNQAPPGPVSNWGEVVALEDNSIFVRGNVLLISNGFQVSLGQISHVLTDGQVQFSSGAGMLGLNAASPANATYRR